MIWGSGGSKSRLAKAAGAEPAGQMRDEKLHADVARSTFRSQNVQSTHQLRTTFSSWDVEKVHAIVARSTFRSQNVKSTRGSDHFWTFRCAFAWQAQGIVDLVKSEQNVRVFEAFPKTMAGVGHLKRICKDAFSVAGAIQETCSSELLGGPGRWFPERGCILEHQIFRFAEMILRDRCSTSYDPVSLFRGRRSSLDRWSRKIAKRIGTRPSALHSIFHFWRKSRWIASFLMLSTLKNEEVSQNCFVFDVVKCKYWESLAELQCFF